MQREWSRLAQQLHLSQLAQKVIALPPVAAVAAGHQVLPGREAAARARLHMIQRELAGIENDAAVLAGVAVARRAGSRPALPPCALPPSTPAPAHAVRHRC